MLARPALREWLGVDTNPLFSTRSHTRALAVVAEHEEDDAVVLTYEFDLGREEADAGARFELLIEWRERRIETGIDVPISP